MLDKDASTRVTAAELWDDPWVTDEGAQPLTPYEENCIEFAEPTQADLDRALNSLRASTFIAMSVVAKLKGMVSTRDVNSVLLPPPLRWPSLADARFLLFTFFRAVIRSRPL